VSSPSDAATRRPPPGGSGDDTVERVREAMRGLRFGSITVTVQDGVVVQIDRTEKLRIDRPRRR